jgi:hypothetical protein
MVSWNDIKPYLSHEDVPKCPDGGAYIVGRVGEPPEMFPRAGVRRRKIS